MLVLTRRRDQAIMIGDDVEITIVDIRGDKVRLGIRAPATVSVHRREVYDAIRDANRKASEMTPEDLGGLPVGKVADPTLSAHAGEPPQRAPWSPATSASDAPGKVTHTAEMERSMDPFLRAAIDEAKRGLAEGGPPIGAVLVRGNQIIGRGHNRQKQRNDPTAHAEIDCLTNAGPQQKYDDTVLYSTLMPCYLCSGAAVQFGVPKVVVGESVNIRGDHSKGGTSQSFMRSHGIEVVDLHDAECIEMMGKFFRAHPELWKDNIAK